MTEKLPVLEVLAVWLDNAPEEAPTRMMLRLDASKLTTTDAYAKRGLVGLIRSYLNSYDRLLDHLIELDSETWARERRREEKGGAV